MAQSTKYISTLFLIVLMALFPILWSCSSVYDDVDSDYAYDYPANDEGDSGDEVNPFPAEAYYPHHEPMFQHTVTPSANDMPYGG